MSDIEENNSNYATLVSAITDAGYWRWWSELLPKVFQIEFGGVQIYVPPDDNTKPPSSLLALRFYRPSRVSFLRRRGAPQDLPEDWPQLLQQDKIEPFDLDCDDFACGDESLFQKMLTQAESEITHFQDDAGGKKFKFVFWSCRGAGLRIEADEVRPVLKEGDRVDLATIQVLHGEWWKYWKDYWAKRGTTEALPKDYACEVTIPIKPE